MKTFAIYKVRYSWGEGNKVENMHVVAENSVDAVIRVKQWAEQQFPVTNTLTPMFIVETKYVPCANILNFVEK